MATSRTPKAFTLIELLLVIAIIAVLISILLPALAQARGSAKRALCLSNMGQMARANASYATDYQDFIATYSWVPGNAPSIYADIRARVPALRPGGNPGPDFTYTTFLQLTDILRRRTGDDSIPVAESVARTRIANRHFNHAILNDYLATVLPDRSMACPDWRPLLLWQTQPRLQLDPFPNTADRLTEYGFWKYASSYQVVPAAWAADRMPPGVRQSETSAHEFFVSVPAPGRPNDPWGGRKTFEVTFPSSKVAYFDMYDFHSRRPRYHASPDARNSLMFWDASVRVFVTEQTNPGWRPDQPTSPNPTLYQYNPVDYYRTPGIEPRTRSGQPSELVRGHFRWTRGGLKGIDVPGEVKGVSEISTGQPR